MNNPTDKIIPLSFVSPFVLDLQYGDIRTHSGKTLKKSKKILKKKEEHDVFINFVLENENFTHVSRKDVLASLTRNDNDYGGVLYDLLE
tara:strand:- start:1259 stop:1525 length:267 start_codon:yes stop_codon:yes gene_type:complete